MSFFPFRKTHLELPATHPPAGWAQVSVAPEIDSALEGAPGKPGVGLPGGFLPSQTTGGQRVFSRTISMSGAATSMRRSCTISTPTRCGVGRSRAPRMALEQLPPPCWRHAWRGGNSSRGGRRENESELPSCRRESSEQLPRVCQNQAYPGHPPEQGKTERLRLPGTPASAGERCARPPESVVNG